MAAIRRRRRRHRTDRERNVKDRLIQTRVPSKLEDALKEEAKKRRLTVSHLIRNMLEDTLELVDTVVTSVDGIARSSAGLAEQVARDAGKIAAVARESFRRPSDERAPSPETTKEREGEGEAGPSPLPEEPAAKDLGRAAALESVLAWNPVVVNRTTRCAGCDGELARGNRAFLGITADPSAPPTWLCAGCTKNMETD